ncbi:hypothetical protein SLA2020_206590 [Shorea laevis]
MPSEACRKEREICCFLLPLSRVDAGWVVSSGFLLSLQLPLASSLPELGFCCWKILVLDPWGTLVCGLNLRFYASEEAKSRTGKTEGSDELEG